MSTPIPTPIALQSAAAKRASLQALMTVPLTLSRDDGTGTYAPIGTVYANVATPTLEKPAPDEQLKAQVALDADVRIGDRFDYDGWTWHVTDRATVLVASIPVALLLLAARLQPVGGSPPASAGTFTPNAVVDRRRGGTDLLADIAAQVETPRPGSALPEGEPIDYVVLVPLETDIELNDMLVLKVYAGVPLDPPDLLRVRARMWQGAAPNALRRLLVRDTQIGG